jgi:CDP-alcohol phosphatidyltransferase
VGEGDAGYAKHMSTARAARTVDAATGRDTAHRRRRTGPQSAFTAPRVTIKDRDACWTVFVIDPVAVPLAALAARSKPVTPNRLTALSALVALGAAALFASSHFTVGAVVFQLSFLLDCMDGKLASMRQIRNGWGAFFDVAGDNVRFVACFVALALATFDGHWDVLQLLPVLLYPCARFGLLAMAEARPSVPGRGSMSVLARPWDVLRLAPRRATKPGATVDAEAVAITLGPLTHLTLQCFAVAAALHLMHAALMFVGSLRQSPRGSSAADGTHT